jgi:hypothetical protein
MQHTLLGVNVLIFLFEVSKFVPHFVAVFLLQGFGVAPLNPLLLSLPPELGEQGRLIVQR